MTVVSCNDLGIRFARGSRREMLRDSLARLLHPGREPDDGNALWALRHVDLAVPEGSCLGVCGANGAGKTTLLRLIAGIYEADEGSVDVSGRTTAMLSLGAGISPHLSGRDNVLVASAVHGLSRGQAEELYPAIAEFAELDEATMRTPVRYYSSGMRTRLGFSIASAVVPDILLLDEILTVGDPRFREKSGARLAELIGKARCLVVTSHSVSFLKSHCDYALWLDGGEARAFGEAVPVLNAYGRFMGLNT
jgi:ABC-type polysaccharide/polyol phosphate transport system ATPase subunit